MGKYSLYEKNKYTVEIDYIDYQKVKLDGYDGVYYSKEIIQNIDKLQFNIPNSIYRNFNTINNNGIEKDIISHIKWLETDTLMLWNMDFI